MMLNIKLKEDLCKVAINLEDSDYSDKKLLCEVLNKINNDVVKDDAIKYLFNSTQTNYKLGLVLNQYLSIQAKESRNIQMPKIIIKIKVQ